MDAAAGRDAFARLVAAFNEKVIADVVAKTQDELAGEGLDACVLQELQAVRTLPFPAVLM